MPNEDDYVTVEVYIVMNEDGEHAVGDDPDNTDEAFNENYNALAKEVTKINIRMKKPKHIAREVSAELPDNASEATFVLTQV